MTFRDDVMRLADKMDMHKRFPGYFSKWVFRSAILVMVVLFFFVFAENPSFKPRIYLECPSGAFGERCANPFYGPGCVTNLPAEHWGLCEQQYFFAGQTYGVRPSFLFENFQVIGLLLVLLAFGVNHLLYVRRSGQWRYSR